MALISNKQHSKMDWWNEGTQYPGDEKIQVGCLQRIADSLEKMEQPYARLLDSVEFLRKRNRSLESNNETLRKQVAAYKGVIKRMKKQKSI